MVWSFERMSKFYIKYQFLILILASCITTSANACTTLIIHDTAGNVYQGRTMEFGSEFPFLVTYFPAGSKFVSQAPLGKTPIQYNTSYNFVGITAKVGNHFYLADGINNQGLTFTINSFHGGEGTTLKQNKDILDANDLGTWILGSYKTTDEVKSALQKQAIWLSPMQIFMGAKYPFHIAIFDRSGKGIVVEYANGKQNIYDNPVGVMTNGPDFTWHLTNLNNYTSVSNVGNSSSIINGYATKAVDVGGNIAGLPADDSSPSRFVRAAFYTNYTIKPESSVAIATLGKIMNKFDRMRGVTTFANSGGNSESVKGANQQNGEWTLFTTLRDLQHDIYYVRPENSINYYKFDLNQLSTSPNLLNEPVAGLIHSGYSPAN